MSGAGDLFKDAADDFERQLAEADARIKTRRREKKNTQAKPPDPLDPKPDAKTGMYHLHVVDYVHGEEYEMTLNPKKPGAAVYHNATLIIRADTTKKLEVGKKSLAPGTSSA